MKDATWISLSGIVGGTLLLGLEILMGVSSNVVEVISAAAIGGGLGVAIPGFKRD